MARVRIDPGDHEDREALRHSEAHEAFFRREVEDIVFVDPRRNDQQWALVDCLGRRRILDQFDEIVAIDDLAGRRREIHADFEFRSVVPAYFESAFAGLYVLGQERRAADEIVAARGPSLFEELGIGGEKIRGRKGAGDLPQVEFGLVAELRIEIFRPVDEIIRPARHHGMGLPQKIEKRAFAPFGSCESLIGRVEGDDRIFCFAGEAAQCMAPKGDEIRRQRGLSLDGSSRIAEPVFRDPAE